MNRFPRTAPGSTEVFALAPRQRDLRTLLAGRDGLLPAALEQGSRAQASGWTEALPTSPPQTAASPPDRRVQAAASRPCSQRRRLHRHHRPAGKCFPRLIHQGSDRRQACGRYQPAHRSSCAPTPDGELAQSATGSRNSLLSFSPSKLAAMRAARSDERTWGGLASSMAHHSPLPWFRCCGVPPTRQ